MPQCSHTPWRSVAGRIQHRSGQKLCTCIHGKTCSLSRIVVIHCNDTDVHIIFLYHLGTGNIKANVWMDAVVDGNNTRHYVNVSGLSKELCPDLCSTLPETLLHRMWLRHGIPTERKSATTEIYGEIIHCTICKSRRIPTVTNISGFEAFVSELYGKPKTNSTSTVRFAIFRDKYAPTNTASPLNKLSGAKSSALLPSNPVLIE